MAWIPRVSAARPALPDQAYPETNCYADVLIELLHAHGDEPLAALGAAVAVDFEGDQWTFFKPSPQDLEALFGIDIHEMQPYRPLPEQVEEQIELGRTIIVELDSWFLPDTASTTYHQSHVKSSAAIEAIDPDREYLSYFHNGGLYELTGADYQGALRMMSPAQCRCRPTRSWFGSPRATGSARRTCVRLPGRPSATTWPDAPPRTRSHATGNRFRRISPPPAASNEQYHDYAFATLRMAGASFHLCAAHIDWLFDHDGAAASAELARILAGARALSFKLARKREFDPAPLMDELADAWDAAVGELSRLAA